ncbi:MAG TPA: MFS transporter [Verrucomicrobiae bacterium]|nr:MFS transporter [Verrucomicrobiae bacterium]
MASAAPETGPAPGTGLGDVAGLRQVLRNRNFRLLWLAQVAAQLGDKFFAFSLLLSIYALTGQYISDAVLLLAYTIPSVLLSVPAGLYADRYDKRQLMVWANAIRAVLVLLVAVLEATGVAQHQAAPLYLITLVFAGVGQFFAPAEAASIPSLVRRRELLAATSLFTMTVIVTIVVAVPAASLAQRLLGLEGPYYLGCALFVGSVVAIWGIRTQLGTGPQLASQVDRRDRSALRDVRQAFTTVRHDPLLRFAFLVLTAALVVVFTIFALSAGYMVHVLDQPAANSYILLVPATAGMVGMGTVVGRSGVAVHRTATVVRGLAATGCAMLVLGVLPQTLAHFKLVGALIPIAIGLAVVFGLGLGAVLIPAVTLIQEQTEEATRGTVFGGAFVAINLAIAAPLLVAGAIADAIGASAVIAASGVGLLGAAWGAHRHPGGSAMPRPRRDTGNGGVPDP